MKTILILGLLIAILGLSQVNCDEATDLVQEKIRAYGTQIFQLIEKGEDSGDEDEEDRRRHHKKREEDSEETDSEETDSGEEKKEFDPITQVRIERLLIAHEGLFNGNRLELPKVCKERLTSDQFIALLQKGKFFVETWAQASGQKNIVYNNLPYLNCDQFAVFYQIIGDDALVDGDEVNPNLIDDNCELLQLVSWGDRNREEVSWLEFWSHMCIGEEMPNNQDWLREPRSEHIQSVHNEARDRTVVRELEQQQIKRSILNGETLSPEHQPKSDNDDEQHSLDTIRKNKHHRKQKVTKKAQKGKSHHKH